MPLQNLAEPAESAQPTLGRVGPDMRIDPSVASTSAFGEGFSNVIAEGMSVGLVPVATDVGDARRIVGDAGSIVAPRDPQAFAIALQEVAALPDAERRRRGLVARERIGANFTLERTADAFAQLYTAA